jgi:hypothetical protein
MNDQQRTELLAALEALSRRYPDWRLGQLIANVAGWADKEIWDVEDEQLLNAARSHLSQITPSGAMQSSTARLGR